MYFGGGTVLVLVLSDIVANGDEVVVVFERTGEEVSVINRVA